MNGSTARARIVRGSILRSGWRAVEDVTMRRSDIHLCFMRTSGPARASSTITAGSSRLFHVRAEGSRTAFDERRSGDVSWMTKLDLKGYGLKTPPAIQDGRAWHLGQEHYLVTCNPPARDSVLRSCVIFGVARSLAAAARLHHGRDVGLRAVSAGRSAEPRYLAQADVAQCIRAAEPRLRAGQRGARPQHGFARRSARRHPAFIF